MSEVNETNELDIISKEFFKYYFNLPTGSIERSSTTGGTTIPFIYELSKLKTPCYKPLLKPQ